MVSESNVQGRSRPHNEVPQRSGLSWILGTAQTGLYKWKTLLLCEKNESIGRDGSGVLDVLENKGMTGK